MLKNVYHQRAFLRRLMRISIFQFIFIILLNLVAVAHTIRGQGVLDRRISLEVSNLGIKIVLKKIEKNAAVRFAYQPQLLSNMDRVSVAVEDTPLSDLLRLIFREAVQYEVVGDQIILRENLAERVSTETINGQVLDENKQPMYGVNVVEKGTTNGTITDVDGKFSLTVADESSILVVSSIGYVQQEVAVGRQSNLTISMQPDLKQLEDVVVVGYGTQKKKDMTTAVARVTSQDIANQPVNNITDAMVGKMAGVTITQGTGQPGAPLTVKVRGVGTITAGSDPLYVVDGMPLSGPNLNTLNNNDIESVEVLKDASSAAIYGSRGSNGVVIITTKKGNSGKTVFNYNAYTGFQSVSHKIKMLDAYQNAQLTKDARNNTYSDQMQQINRINMANGRPTISFSLDDSNAVRLLNTNNNANTVIPTKILPYLRNESGLTNTDWQDEIFRIAPIQCHSLSAAGGSPNTRYYSSLEYFKQGGIVINSNFERFNARFNFESNKGIARFGFNFNPSLIRENLVRTDGSPYTFAGAAVGNALLSSPMFSVYNDDGSYNFLQNSWPVTENTVMPNGTTIPGNLMASTWNPVAVANLIKFNSSTSRFLSSTFAEFEFLENLKYKITVGADIVNSRENQFIPSTLPIQQNPTNAPSVASGYSRTNSEFNWMLEHVLNYSKKISKHTIDGLAVWSNQKDNIKSNYVLATKGFLGNQIPTLNAGTVTGGDSREAEWALASGLTRVQYNFNEKYLFTGSIRADGSSKFGANNRWGYFPSASVGWRISQESFLKDSKKIEELKIRFSYGLTGNFNIPNYAALGSLSYYSYVFGATPSVVNGAAPSTRENPNLQWEKTSQANVGLDASFFQNKLRLTLDLYNSLTKGLLLNVPVPPSTGFTSQLQNIGQVRNKGIELNIGTMQEFGELKWEGSMVFARNINTVVALGPGDVDIIQTGSTGSTYFINRVGKQIGSYFLPDAIGVFKNQAEVDSYFHYTDSPGNYDLATSKPGDLKILDADGDGKIDFTKDRVILGSYLPKFTYGFTSGFRYKNFDLNFALQGVYGNKILNLSKRHLFGLDGMGSSYAGAADRWRSESEPGNGVIPRANRIGKGGNGIAVPTSYLVEDGSYLRIRNITFGYSLPIAAIRKYAIDKVHLFVALQNYFTFTKYLGYNPEVSNPNRSDVATAGEDYNVYPTAKTMSFGVNLTF